LIIDYVAVIVDLWRAAGLRPARAHDPANPKYRSHFHRFVELVLTAMIDPWCGVTMPTLPITEVRFGRPTPSRALSPSWQVSG
jgi:hypothetical protein